MSKRFSFLLYFCLTIATLQVTLDNQTKQVYLCGEPPSNSIPTAPSNPNDYSKFQIHNDPVSSLHDLFRTLSPAFISANNLFDNFEPQEQSFYTPYFDKISDQTVLNSLPFMDKSEDETIDTSSAEINGPADSNGWEEKGPYGIKITSSGVIKCSMGFLSQYILVPSGVVYDTSKMNVSFLGDLLGLWNSTPKTCYTSAFATPVPKVAGDSVIIPTSSKAQLCFYGRITKNKQGLTFFIRGNYFEVDANTLNLKCDRLNLSGSLTNRFNLQDKIYDGENNNYCSCSNLGN